MFINFYDYFNFFYFNKKNFFNVILNVWFNKNTSNNVFLFSVLRQSTKVDIKNSVEFFLGIKIYKLNTLMSKKKKKKKAIVYFYESF